MNREFLEDYEQRENSEYDKVLKRIEEGEFTLGTHKNSARADWFIAVAYVQQEN